MKFNGTNAVELELPADMTIHDTLNVSRIKKYTADQVPEKPAPPPDWTVGDKDGTILHSYVVEVITSHKRATGVKCGYKYQIKWEGYDDDEMTLEPAAIHSKQRKCLMTTKHNTDREKQEWRG